jgi:hypothetical protein
VAGTITAHGSVGWVIAALAGPLSLPLLLSLEASSWPMPLWAVQYGWKLGLVVLVGGFLWFEVFAWLGVRRCKFANREKLSPEVCAVDSPQQSS